MRSSILQEATAAIARATVWQEAALAAIIVVLLLIGYFVHRIIYNLYFHRLSSYPGPVLARGSQVWICYYMLQGSLAFKVERLHRIYGPVVRIAPDELVYDSANAWKDIYGIRPGKSEIPKDPLFYLNTAAGIESIIAAPAQRHGELRRLLSYGFSERALRAQFDIIQGYVDYLIARLRGESSKGGAVDMVKWYNFFTFDVIGDLAFNDPFNCLKTGQMHPWIATMTNLLSGGDWPRAADRMPMFKPLLKLATPKWAIEGYAMHIAMMKKKALNRLNLKGERLDFMTRMASPNSGLSQEQFIASADTVILGGSETTSTLLSGCTYFLLKNPDKLQKLVAEVRSAFQSEEEITPSSINSLTYMLACLDEAFRLYPPIAGSLPRRTVQDEIIDGKLVPAGTTLSIFQWAINRRPDYWARVDEYIPERWLDDPDPEFKNDNRAAMQPFSVGARNCIGRNLAYVEMRLVLARLLFNFDLEPTPQMEGWMNQVIHLLWEKPPLMVNLKSRDVAMRAAVTQILQEDMVKA